MIRYFRSLVLLSLIAVMTSISAQPNRVGAPFIPEKDWKTELFRGVLHFYGVSPLTEEEIRDLKPKDYQDVIVVVLGCSDEKESKWAATYTQKALQHGGAVLIATDQKCDLSGFFPNTPARSIQVTGINVEGNQAANTYLQTRRLPFVDRVTPGIAWNAPEQALFSPLPPNLELPIRVATNMPSYLEYRRAPADASMLVAEFPAGSTLGGRLISPDALPFALAGSGTPDNPARCLVLADTDVFSNEMLYSSGMTDIRRTAPANWGFTVRLVREFLREPTERHRCLFVENGKVITKFDQVELKSIQQAMPTPQIPLPNPLDRQVQQKFADLLDSGINKLEERNAVDNLLAGPPGDQNLSRYQITMMALAAAGGLLLLVLMVRRLYSARHSKNFIPAPTDPLFLGDKTALGSFGQRRSELLRGSDFRDPVVFRIRELLTARGLPTDYTRRRLPPLEFRGRNDRDRLGWSIRRLWNVVTGDESRPLPYSEWKDLEPILAEVHTAALNQRWRFAPSPPPGSA